MTGERDCPSLLNSSDSEIADGSTEDLELEGAEAVKIGLSVRQVIEE